jgi:hypothetical protein
VILVVYKEEFQHTWDKPAIQISFNLLGLERLYLYLHKNNFPTSYDGGSLG